MASPRERADLNELVNTQKVIPDPLVRSSVGQSAGRSGLMTGMVAKLIQASPLRSKTDRGKSAAKSHAKPAVEALEVRPAKSLVRQLTAVIYAEATTQDLGGEDETEKLAIGATFVNRAYYAHWKPPEGKSKCFNSDFGDGTVWGAITAPTGSNAVGGRLWSDIVAGHDLKPQADLEKTLKLKTQRHHYNLSVQAAAKIAAITSPISIALLANRSPIAFNQSSVGTPAPRWERLGKLGKHHYFYAFKAGHECD